MEFPKRVQRLRSGLLLGAAFALAALPGQAEMRPTLSFSGVTGLIDMPTGESHNDGVLSITSAHFGPISRTTLSFGRAAPLPRVRSSPDTGAPP